MKQLSFEYSQCTKTNLKQFPCCWFQFDTSVVPSWHSTYPLVCFTFYNNSSDCSLSYHYLASFVCLFKSYIVINFLTVHAVGKDDVIWGESKNLAVKFYFLGSWWKEDSGLTTFFVFLFKIFFYLRKIYKGFLCKFDRFHHFS